MCGIAGTLNLPGVTPRLLESLAHRGPDRSRHHEQGVASGIGAARLRITGGPQGDMPLASSSGRWLLVLNGEVFNHRELPGGPGPSDVSRLPDLLESEGVAALSRIRGPFALAALDLVEGALLIARDESGVRPLFFHQDGERVAVASEIGALLDHVAGDARDDSCWDHLLAFHFWPPGLTPYREIRSLRPGTWMRFQRAGGRLRTSEGGFRCREREEDPALALERAFDLQAPCRVPVGVTLSGGLDSSAVAALLCRRGQAPAVAAVGFFPEASDAFDERPHARRVARDLGLPLMEVPITAADYLEVWPSLLRALGGPLAGPGGPSQWIVARALAAEGVKVVFSGLGGDELFGGYERHRLLLQSDLGLPVRAAPGYERLAASFASHGLEGMLFRGREFLPFLESDRRRGVLSAAAALPPPGALLAERVIRWEAEHILPGLLDVEDRTLAAFGMEGRVPLLDPVLKEAALAVPLKEKSPPEEPRRLFRRLVGKQLPPGALARRDKMGFPVPLERFFASAFREVLCDARMLSILEDLGFRPEITRAVREGGGLSPRGRAFLLAAALSLETERARRGEVLAP